MAEISLTRNKTTVIDDCDLPLVQKHSWFAQENSSGGFYASADIKNESGIVVRTYLHRFLTNPPTGFTTRHKDGNGLNNRRDNLEICAKGQSPRRDSDEGYRGVYYNPKGLKPWRAVITVDGKSRHLGVFSTAEEAALKRDEAAIKLWGHDALLNFPRTTETSPGDS